MFGLLAAFCLTWIDRIPTDFHSQILWELFFLALVQYWDPLLLNPHMWVYNQPV